MQAGDADALAVDFGPERGEGREEEVEEPEDVGVVQSLRQVSPTPVNTLGGVYWRTIICTIGCVRSKREGRTKAATSFLLSVSSVLSASVCSRSLPVSLRRRFAFRRRSVGAHVSGSRAAPRTWMTAAAMLVDQKTQCHVLAWAIQPPATGPMAGPSSGARLYRPTALPRCSGFQQSLCHRVSPRTFRQAKESATQKGFATQRGPPRT